MAKEWIVPEADLGCDGAYFDYQELVRCMECDLWNDWDHAKELRNFVCSCAHWSNEDGYVVYTKPDDFCSYGERKDGNFDG